MTDQPQPTPPIVPAPPAPPVEGPQEEETPSRFRLVTAFLVVLIVGVVAYLDQFTPVDLRLINFRLSPDELGRQVTYVNISPLSDVTASAGDSVSTKVETTIYTKIGHKPVQAAGRLDLALKDASGNVLESWRDIKLPPQGSDVEWGGFPLGGWQVNLRLRRLPASPKAYLDATYTNPANKQFTARAPVEVTAR
jgi:hypothetical protein